MKIPAGHIVFLTPGFAESESDNTTIPALQDYILAISKAASNDTQFTIITFQFPFRKQPYYWHGIQVIPLNGRNQKWNKLLIWRKAIQNLKKLDNERHITHIHSFWIGECSFIGQSFAKKRNIEHIVTAMGQDVFGNRFARFIDSKFSKIITLSNPHHDLLKQNHRIDSTIIPWSIAPATFPDLNENTVDILGVGSLTDVKNYPAFIRIVKMIAIQVPNLKVEIIGEGNQMEHLKQQIAKENLTSVIILKGKLNRIEVYNKMSQSKVLLHTSRYESFGYVFAEALYSGMKIVSHKVGISAAIPQWKTANTEVEMSEAIRSFLNDNSPKIRIELTTKEQMLNAYSELYNG